MKKNETVLVAMSGGVDSSVTLLRIIEMGYEAIGITMKLWEYKNFGGNNITLPKVMAVLPRIGLEYGFLEKYFFRGGYGNDRLAFGFGYKYELFKRHDSNIDYAFSMDWVSQTAHTISYAFHF